MGHSLKQLESEIEQKLQRLTPKQRKFVLAYSKGGITQDKAAIQAGYSAKSADRNAFKVKKATAPLISLIDRKLELEQGQNLSDHRFKLMNLFSLCADPDAETWEPRTAHSIARTLLEIDGFLQKNGSQEKEITINIVDPVAAITQQNQQVRPAIEHDPAD